MAKHNKNWKFDTTAAHGGTVPNAFGALADPIYQTSTFVFETAEQGGNRFLGEEEGPIYSRLGNPTNATPERKLALLEEGEAAIAFASGMGAITSMFWTFLSGGDHLIASERLYGCTFNFIVRTLTRFGVEVDLVDTTDPANVEKAMKPNTKIVYIESPVNPNMELADIEAIAKVAHKQEGVRLVVDNTFATPAIQKPLKLGADIVVHSATKYLNGHGDVIAGFAVGTADDVLQMRKVGLNDATGAVMAPFVGFLVNRGMKTLGVRMRQHCENAQVVAEYLEKHPKVNRVYYPGLDSFPQKELADRQMEMPGAMIAFEIEGDLESGKRFLNQVGLCKLAVSLGDCESLIEHPASMTHAAYTQEEQLKYGITDTLIRLSVGLENPEDVIADLEQAFAVI